MGPQVGAPLITCPLLHQPNPTGTYPSCEGGPDGPASCTVGGPDRPAKCAVVVCVQAGAAAPCRCCAWLHLSLAVSLGAAAIVLMVGLAEWGELPDPMAVHFDIHGKANGFAPKLVGVFLLPLLAPLLSLLIFVLSRHDPLYPPMSPPSKDAISAVVILPSLLLGAVQLLTLAANTNQALQLNIPGLTAVLGGTALVLGPVMGNVEQNHVVGIRTKWSLASRTNWKRTHHLASLLYFWGGGIVLVLSLVRVCDVALFFSSITALFLPALAGFIYSAIMGCNPPLDKVSGPEGTV